MKPVLTKEQSAEVERIMELALDWLMSWDVTDGSSPAPEKERVAAMHRLKEGVIGIVCKAPSNAKVSGSPALSASPCGLPG